jgi:anti-sigma B factor antagonist
VDGFTPPPFAVAVETTATEILVRVNGELDMHTMPRLEAQLGEFDGDARALVIDLRAVTFIDSSGIRALVHAHQAARRHQRRLRMTAPHENVLRTLEVAGLLGVLPLEDA